MRLWRDVTAHDGPRCRLVPALVRRSVGQLLRYREHLARSVVRIIVCAIGWPAMGGLGGRLASTISMLEAFEA